MNQRKIIDSFKPIEFMPGQALIKEGEISDKAYLIREGECTMQSSKSPLSAFSHIKKGAETTLKAKRGFLSQSTNTFQFGILESKQWAGEERLLRKEEFQFSYSIIAKTHVKAYEITKYDARRKLTAELMMYLVKISEQRFQWIDQHTRYLIQSAKKLANMDPSKEKYDDNLAEIRKKFPAASLQAITNIQKKHMALKSASMSTMSLNASKISLNEEKASMTMKKSSVLNRTDEMFIMSTVSTKSNAAPVPPFKSSTATSIKMPAYSAWMSTLSSQTPKGSNLRPIVTVYERPFHQMNMATSSPHALGLTSLIPKFPKPFKSSIAIRMSEEKFKKVLSTRNTSSSVTPAMPEGMKNFQVGNRTIRILNHSDIYRKKPNTPRINYLTNINKDYCL